VYWPLGRGFIFINDRFVKGDASIVPAMVKGEFVKEIEDLILKILDELDELENKGIKLP